MQQGGAQKYDEPGNRPLTMNWEPTTPLTKPTSVLASPLTPMICADNASCASPPSVPANKPTTGPNASAA